LISQFIHWTVDVGINGILYDAFFAAGFVAVLIFNLVNCKNFKIKVWKAILFTVLVYTLSVLWMFFLYWAESGFKDWGGNNIVRIFIWVPLFAWPVAKLLKLDWKTCCEYIAPCLCVVHGVAHLGCIFAGCCHGYPWKYGIWNPQLDCKTFPVQPIEAIVAIAIVIVICVRQKRRSYDPDGLSYPLMLILFGSTRFMLEFARDNDKLFLGISSLALHALLMLIVGLAFYFSLTAINAKKSKYQPRKVHKS